MTDYTLGANLDTTPAEIRELLPFMSEDERKWVGEAIARDAGTQIWRPLPGPQFMAYISEADVVGYGGAAGGGKTDLMCGSALTKHSMSLLMRREYTQMKGIVQRMTEILGDRTGYNGQDKIWRIPGMTKTVEFGSTPNLGDELNYQGRPRDLLGIDEATNFLQQMVEFLMGWVRTTIPGQQTQTLLTFNPPTTSEGRWVVDFFAPWLDDRYANPAEPGELRFFAMIDGEEFEVENGNSFMHKNELILPSSRTFIPSRISDNPFLMNTGYVRTLQRMPEPLRSQMLYGDFKAGMTDDPWQVIPTAWVKDAMARWKDQHPKPELQSMGIDVARGGKDKNIIADRCTDYWWDQLKELPGSEAPNGPVVAAWCISHHRNDAPMHIDVIGVGASPYDFLVDHRQPVIGVNVAESAKGTDKSGRLRFANLRSELWWRMRETLDPANNLKPALPPDPELEKELCAPYWRLKNSTVYVESREEIVKRIGRSPDKATAVILSNMETPKFNPYARDNIAPVRRSYQPFGGNSVLAQTRRDYNPLR